MTEAAVAVVYASPTLGDRVSGASSATVDFFRVLATRPVGLAAAE